MLLLAPIDSAFLGPEFAQKLVFSSQRRVLNCSDGRLAEERYCECDWSSQKNNDNRKLRRHRASTISAKDVEAFQADQARS